MKLLKLLTFLLMLMTVVMACSKSELWSEGNPYVYAWPEGKKYYYTFEEKTYLNEVPNEIVVSFDKKYLTKIQTTLLKNTQISNMILDDVNNIFILTTTGNTDLKALMKDLKKQTGVKSVNPVYMQADYISPEMYFTDEISVLFKDNVFRQEIIEIHKKYRVTVKKHPYPDLFPASHQILSVPVNADMLGIANAYQESGLVIYSYPNFLSKSSTTLLTFN